MAGGLTLALLVAAAAGPAERFDALLRSYPDRPAEETLAQVAALVEQGPFEGRDRAEYWLASAWLALGEGRAARAWAFRLVRDAPGSTWAARALLVLGDADAREHRYRSAYGWYARAAAARDPELRALARSAADDVRAAFYRQVAARVALAFAAAVALFFVLAARPRRLWPPPLELVCAAPLLAVVALAAVRLDQAPRRALLEICGGGAVLLFASGVRLRGLSPRPGPRLAHAGLALAALASLCFSALGRAELLGLVAETLRTGPE